MAKSSNQKSKLLYMVKILKEYTDENHGLTTQDMIKHLKAYGIEVERKTVYDDIDELIDFGYDIVKEKEGKMVYYKLLEREFDISELKWLVDAVQSSKFLTDKKSKKLISKLVQFTSKYNADLLKRQLYVSGRVSSMNESIFYNVDSIHEAISNNRQVTFKYFSWGTDGKPKFKHDGKVYKVSPWALIYDDGNYYLDAYDEEKRDIKTYRVDKMQNIAISLDDRLGRDIFELKDKSIYSRNRFGMYSGEEATVTLLCKNEMSNVIIDRFGKDVHMMPQDDEHFTVRVSVMVSNIFLGWIMGVGNIKIVSPERLVERMDAFRSTEL